jgi:soluble lytic murein transglycosylase-like protein
MKKLTYLLAGTFLSVIVYASLVTKPIKPKPQNNAEKMYSAIILYADSFNIPIHIAFNVARIETGYRGPHHKDYNHKQVSSAGAVGAMQIMPQYASYFAGFPVKRQELKDSIELNVYVSMRCLSLHYKKYKDWKKVLGTYNTGKPVINAYARNGVVQNYQDFWVKPKNVVTNNDTIILDEEIPILFTMW